MDFIQHITKKIRGGAKMKAYKGFSVNKNNQLYCRYFTFEIGNEYEITGSLELCKNGFHFCWNLNDVHAFYNFNNSVIAEIEVLGSVINEADMTKSVTDKMKIIRLLTKEEILKMSNTQPNNTGFINSGDYNSGDYNSGDYNSGNCNSGDYNSGNCNSGDYNSGNYNSGFFNTKSNNKIYIFDIISDYSKYSFFDSQFYKALSSVTLKLTEWVEYTAEERVNDKAKELIGGYLKTYSYKEAYKKWWAEMSESNKNIILQIPNFDKAKFLEITGIEV